MKFDIHDILDVIPAIKSGAFEPSRYEMWAMALSAPCYPDPVPSMGLITGFTFFSPKKKRIRKDLIDKYGHIGTYIASQGRHRTIHDISDYILRDAGHMHFQQMRARLILLGGNADEWISQLTDAQYKRQMSLALKYLYLLPSAGILAYNISRSIYYNRCSLLFGRESINTGMSKIMDKAQLAQSCYGSWEEFYTAFAVGKQFLHPDTRASGEHPREHLGEHPGELMNSLMDMMVYLNKPETFLPWNMPLKYKFGQNND
jgi:hypothetical protein